MGTYFICNELELFKSYGTLNRACSKFVGIYYHERMNQDSIFMNNVF